MSIEQICHKGRFLRQFVAGMTALGCVFAVVGLGSISWAREISLDEAIKLARANNPDLAAVAQELTIASGELQRAECLSPFNPQLGSEADYRRRSDRSNTQDWRVELAQEIEVFGQRGLRIKSARVNLDESRNQVADQRRLLDAAVRLSWFDAVRARRQVDLLGELHKLDSSLYDAARERYRVGEISYIEYNLSRMRYGQTSRALIEGRLGVRLRQAALGRILGMPADIQPSPSVGGAALPQPPATVDVLVQKAFDLRPDLRARQLEIARIETEAELNRRLALPNLTVGAFGGHELNTEYPIGGKLGFSIPLFNRRQGEATSVQGELIRAKHLERGARLDIEREVRDAYARYIAAREALNALESDVIGPASESFKLLQEAFIQGKMDLLRLAVAEREAFDARSQYIDAQFEVNSAMSALELATGGGQ